VNYLPAGSALAPCIAFDLDNETGAFYDTDSNAITIVQKTRPIASFRSNGLYASKCVFDNAHIERANVEKISTETVDMSVCKVETMLADNVTTNFSTIEFLNADTIISNTVSSDMYNVNASLIENATIETGFFDNSEINVASVEKLNCNVSNVDTAVLVSSFNEKVSAARADTVQTGVGTLFVKTQFQNTAFCTEHWVDKATANIANCTVGYIDTCIISGANVDSLTCGTSNTFNATTHDATIGNWLITGDLFVSGNLYTFGDVDYFDSNLEVKQEFSIKNMGTGPALDLRGLGAADLVEISSTNTVFKIFDGGLVHLAPASSSALSGAPASGHVLRNFGTTKLDELEVTALETNGPMQIGTLSATDATSNDDFTVAGRSAFDSSVTGTTTTITGQVAVGGDVRGQDIIYSGGTSLNSQFTLADAAIQDLVTSTTNYLVQQSTQTQTQLNNHNSALSTDINNFKTSLENQAASASSSLSNYQPRKPAV